MAEKKNWPQRMESHNSIVFQTIRAGQTCKCENIYEYSKVKGYKKLQSFKSFNKRLYCLSDDNELQLEMNA